MNKPVIVDLFESIVTAVSVAYGQTVHFQHGHMKEIVNVTAQLARDPDVSKRYPMIALRHDIPFEVEPMKGIRFDCTVYIITLSRPEYIAAQRMETIFKPLLYPIRDELINQMARSGYFEQSTVDQVDAVAEYIDRLFWGSSTVMGNENNMFNDWIDAIEINFSDLIAYSSCSNPVVYPLLLSAITDTTGRYVYLQFSSVMNDPAAYFADFNLVVNTGFNTPDTVSKISDKVYLLDVDGANIQSGDVLLLQIESGNIASNGTLLSDVVNYPVTNNVQL